ncbi:hypothetical protein B0J11DRAFT_608125 [Dendryphion nanum]|uniref:Heterokaryon incompatibility domain-containing protein n=1 Tax=Dendryphion nanum TaxID=256645 RepID=A0A9P9IHV6_9PLEO|nr:hypothetical protein B0J11DRAFT_608125 [Dendryphion nanum]
MQVALMGEVYRSAHCVVIWLGPQKNESDLALDTLKNIGAEVRYDKNTINLLPAEDSTDSHWSDPEQPLPLSAREFNSIFALYQRPYWKRLWIRQELALARKAIVKCGNKQLDLEMFRNAANCIDWKKAAPGYNEELRTILSFNLLDIVFGVLFTRPYSRYYSSIFWDLGHAQCLDPRDRLYAMRNLLPLDDMELNILPDYSLPVETVYKFAARSILSSHRSLELLQSCEFSTRTLTLPSWVPDWTVQPQTFDRVQSSGSACGWISAQIKFGSDDSLSVAGTKIVDTNMVQELGINNVDISPLEMIRALRKTKPSIEDLSRPYRTGQSLLEVYSRMFFGDNVDASSWPAKFSWFTLESVMSFVDKIWSADTEQSEQDLLDDSSFFSLLSPCSKIVMGRSVIRTTNGHIGLAPNGTQEGDHICVLLGLRVPVILRKVPDLISFTSKYRIVGTCYVQGLMAGETIYRGRLPTYYNSVKHSTAIPKHIDGWRRAMLNTETEELIHNPAAILEEAGIKVESWQERPHVLEVLPETLRAEGLELEDFVII